MTNPEPYVIWMHAPAKPHHLPLMRAELSSYERCSAASDPVVSDCYKRAADNTRQAIKELEGLIRGREEAQ